MPCRVLPDSRKKAVNFKLTKTEQTTNLAIGRTVFIAETSRKIQFLGIAQVFQADQMIVVSHNTQKQTEHLAVSEKFSVINLPGYSAVSLDILADQRKIVMSIPEQ